MQVKNLFAWLLAKSQLLLVYSVFIIYDVKYSRFIASSSPLYLC